MYWVIDLGCGDGRWLSAISRRVDCACFGVEIDDSRLSLARLNFNNDTVQILIYHIFDYMILNTNNTFRGTSRELN